MVEVSGSNPRYPKDKHKDQMIEESGSNPRYPKDKHKDQMIQVNGSNLRYPKDKHKYQMIKVSQSHTPSISSIDYTIGYRRHSSWILTSRLGPTRLGVLDTVSSCV